MRMKMQGGLGLAALLIFFSGVVRAGGEATYAAKCASCHGKDGKGNAAMAKMFKVDNAALDLTDQATLAQKDDELIAVTAKGRGKMPAYAGKMTEAEIAEVVAYMRQLGGGPAKAEAPAAPAPAAAANLDAASKNYAAKCASCHGKDGKGNAAMAKMFKVDNALLDMTDAATLSKTDAELNDLTAKGINKMPGYAGKLKDQEIADLTTYIRSLAK